MAIFHELAFKKLKTELPYDPAISLLEKMKTLIQKDARTPVFTAALSTIAKTWKQTKCPLTDGWIKKVRHTFTMEYWCLPLFITVCPTTRMLNHGVATCQPPSPQLSLPPLLCPSSTMCRQHHHTDLSFVLWVPHRVPLFPFQSLLTSRLLSSAWEHPRIFSNQKSCLFTRTSFPTNSPAQNFSGRIVRIWRCQLPLEKVGGLETGEGRFCAVLGQWEITTFCILDLYKWHHSTLPALHKQPPGDLLYNDIVFHILFYSWLEPHVFNQIPGVRCFICFPIFWHYDDCHKTLFVLNFLPTALIIFWE